MTAEEMKAKCEGIARQMADLHDSINCETYEECDMAKEVNRACTAIADAIAAILVEADPHDAQIATLRKALKLARPYVANGRFEFPEHRSEFLAIIDAAIAATESKGEEK